MNRFREMSSFLMIHFIRISKVQADEMKTKNCIKIIGGVFGCYLLI